MSPIFLIAIAAAILFIFILIFSLVKRYKRCPSDRILVVYGKVGSNVEGNLSAKCIHGGAAFVWPIIQDYAFLDLTPTSIEVNLTNALSRQNIRVDVPSRFTVGISTEPGVMNNAAERLLGLTQAQVHDLAKDIIFGQLRLVVATMDIEEINNNRDKFLANVASNVEAELKKIGLKLINVNVTDIKDESGYIEALGKEAAAKAVNDARKSVAEKTRDGSIGEANANQEERIKVSDANANATVGEAAANARAVEGDNAAKITIANSDASRREAQAEANRLATAAEKVKQAQALEEAYRSEEKAEEARAERDKATQYANVVIPTSIDKQKVEIDAEAEAERIRRLARGQADAIYAKLEAEARGNYELLSKQAEGFKELVSAAGSDPRDAFMLLMAEKLPDIIKTQVEAIKNIKIDKVTVWDSLGKNGEGTNTSNFLSGMYKSVPPLEDLFNQAGLQLPDYLKGKTVEEEKEVKSTDVTKTDEDKSPNGE
ncbi:flotillin family protein [Owenweeksia hongkongensis]|uniref:flotillin family protein n=1 Tax=Owenweeksia hongkongensis TaxID=253245 RepID=UPI003A8E9202